MAARVEPDDHAIRATRAAIYQARAKDETSLMAKGVFTAVADGR